MHACRRPAVVVCRRLAVNQRRTTSPRPARVEVRAAEFPELRVHSVGADEYQRCAAHASPVGISAQSLIFRDVFPIRQLDRVRLCLRQAFTQNAQPNDLLAIDVESEFRPPRHFKVVNQNHRVGRVARHAANFVEQRQFSQCASRNRNGTPLKNLAARLTRTFDESPSTCSMFRYFFNAVRAAAKKSGRASIVVIGKSA